MGGIGTLALAACLLAAGLMWRLDRGPIVITFLADRISQQVDEALPPGVSLRIGEALLARGEGGIEIRLRQVALEAPDGTVLIAAERAAIGLSGLSLLAGRVQPQAVWLIEPDFAVVATEDGLTLESGALVSLAGEGPAPIEAIGVLVSILSDDPGGALREIGVRDGRLSIVRPGQGRATVSPLVVSARRGDAPGQVVFRAGIERGGGSPRLSGDITRRPRGGVDVAIDIRDVALSDVEAALPPEFPAIPTSPVSGRMSLGFAPDGELLAASGRLAVGAGEIAAAGLDILVDEADFAFGWRDSTGRLTIHPSTVLAGHNSGTVRGHIDFPEPGDFNYGTVPMRLEFVDVELGDPRRRHAAAYPSITLEAYYLGQQELLHVSRLDVATADAAMSLVGFVGGGGESPGVRLAGSMAPMSYAALPGLWPPVVGEGAREWVIDNLSAGRIVDARLTVDIAPGMLAASLRGAPLPDSALSLEFGLEDVVFDYLGEFPPMQGASGRARLTGSRFELAIASGARIVLPTGDAIEVGDGRFLVPDLLVDPPIGEVELTVTGDTSTLLRLFDHEPVRLARDRDLRPGDFGGRAAFDVGVRLPLVADVLLEDVELDVSGTIENFTADGLAGATSVREGALDIVIRNNRVAITGRGLIDGVPAEIVLEEPLHGDGDETQSVTMTLDEEARERLGLPLDGVVSGPVVAVIADMRTRGRESVQTIRADLTGAGIAFPELGIEKPPGEGASVGFVLTRTPDEVRLSDISFRSGAIRIDGSATFGADGSLVSVDLPVLRTARGTDVSVGGRREGGEDRYTVRGTALDLRPMLRDPAALARSGDDGREAGTRTPVAVDLDVGSVIGDAGRTLSGMSGSLRLAGGAVRGIDLAGAAGGAPLRIVYSDGGENSDLRVTAHDAGAFLAWTGIYEHMRGGALDLAAGRRGASAAMTGALDVAGFRIVDDPSLAELIESGESATPTANPAGGGMVGFDTLAIPFRVTPQGISVRDGVVRGAAIGASFQGLVDLDTRRLDLHGTYVPLYALNNLFGQVPLIGTLLGGRRNEGLVGITYSVTGPLDQPVLTVNPLSVVAPGVFRYILGMDNPRAYSAPEAPVR